MDWQIGEILEGKVSGITKFGAFVALADGKSGLVHISEVANAIGIHKSLLCRYIYGINKPSESCISKIRNTLHGFARELQTV